MCRCVCLYLRTPINMNQHCDFLHANRIAIQIQSKRFIIKHETIKHTVCATRQKHSKIKLELFASNNLLIKYQYDGFGFFVPSIIVQRRYFFLSQLLCVGAFSVSVSINRKSTSANLFGESNEVLFNELLSFKITFYSNGICEERSSQ